MMFLTGKRFHENFSKNNLNGGTFFDHQQHGDEKLNDCESVNIHIGKIRKKSLVFTSTIVALCDEFLAMKYVLQHFFSSELQILTEYARNSNIKSTEHSLHTTLLCYI